MYEYLLFDVKFTHSSQFLRLEKVGNSSLFVHIAVYAIDYLKKTDKIVTF